MSVNKQKFLKSHPAQATTEDKLSSFSIFLSARIAVGACSEYEINGRSTR